VRRQLRLQWSDGTAHLLFGPVELDEAIAAAPTVRAAAGDDQERSQAQELIA